MADKIYITTDGTVKGTKIKVNGEDMTEKYKVMSCSLHANGGYTYKSQYSGDTYITPPSVEYAITYLDDGKIKNINTSTQSTRYEYSYLNQKDSIIGIGTQDDERVKEKLLDSFDKLRKINSNIPKRILLEKRTVDSLSDKYIDTVNEIEIKMKKEKEKQQ